MAFVSSSRTVLQGRQLAPWGDGVAYRDGVELRLVKFTDKSREKQKQ